MRRVKTLALILALAFIMFACARQPAPPATDGLAVHFVDVGQGDAALLLCGGKAMLVDAGTEKSAQKLVNYIKSLGLTRLDFVVATHPHADHIGGMEAVLDSFEVGMFLMPDALHTTATFERMLDALAENGCGREYITDSFTADLGGASVKALSPREGDSFDNLNNYSAVLSISFEGASLLMTGDAEAEIEARLAESGVGAHDILKVGHHGSKTSSGAAFLAAVKPKFAVICCGAGNEYGHPHAETLENLGAAQIYRTDLCGTVIFTLDGGEVNVSTEKAVRP